MSVYVLGPEQEEAIKRLVKFAEAHPYDLRALFYLQSHPEMAPGNQACFNVLIPGGCRCVFTIEQQPCGWMRHLSLSVAKKGMCPHPVVVEKLCEYFGFKTPPREWAIYLEDLEDGGKAVNVLEPMEAEPTKT